LYTLKLRTVRFGPGFWTEPKKPEPNWNRTENFGSVPVRSEILNRIILLPSDRRKTKFSSLDSSHRDESNGNRLVSLGAIDNEIIRL